MLGQTVATSRAACKHELAQCVSAGGLLVRHNRFAEPDGGTALLYALTQGMAAGSSPRVVLALVATGADVNAKDADGVTALMYAASLESAPILVPALLKKGANAKVADKSGKKAVDYAKQNAKLNGSPALQQLIDAS